MAKKPVKKKLVKKRPTKKNPIKKRFKLEFKKSKRPSSTPKAEGAGHGIGLTEGPPPYEFITTIEKVEGVTITQVNINGTPSKAGEIDGTGASIVCTMKVVVAGLKFGLVIDATGPASKIVTVEVNLTVGGEKAFKEAQKITFDATGRGGFSKDTILLP